MNVLRIFVAGILLACTAVTLSQNETAYSEGGTELCVSCHNFGPESPLMAGPHGGNDLHGCENCHGPSADHANSPVRFPPRIGFGKTEMLNSRSKGCRACHNLVEMAESDKVSDKSKSYHKVMVSSERTCIECHGGIVHAPMGSVTSFSSQPGKGSSGKHSGSKVEVAPK